jgi:hypothetical protein
MLAITVEINPSYDGQDRRVGGLFARDDEKRLYLGPTGRVGGGRPGIGQEAFRAFMRGQWWKPVRIGGDVREAITLGPIGGTGFPGQLAEFVHEVTRFKEQVMKGRAGK